MLKTFFSNNLVFVTSLLISGHAFSSDALPQPLTLEQALSYSESHPNVQLARSGLELAKADMARVSADSGLKVQAEGYLTAIEPSEIAFDQSNNDSKLMLSASKRIYDFGYSTARESAAEKNLKSREWSYFDSHQKHRLGIASKFFAVLVADKDYMYKDEVMTLAYLRYDKARDRHELGQVSDIDLLQLENDYREKLQVRKLAETQQRVTRMKLAAALGRVSDLPADLVMPEVQWDKPLPSLESVVDKALQGNLELRTARNALAAAKQQLTAAQAVDNPVIRGEVNLAEYNRRSGSSHPASASLVLEIPLYTGGESQAEAARARAVMLEREAKLQLVESSVRQAAVELLLELEALQADLQAQQVNSEYTELYLDKNRALYELEVASDYGDATVRVSNLMLKNTRSLLAFALAEFKLAALQGDWQETTSTKIMQEVTQ